MTMEILVDSDRFWERFEKDIAAAEKRIYIQTLSFEGDEIGMKLADRIVSAKAEDRRIIVDNYTKHILSDKLLYSPRNWLDVELWKEKRCTTRMMRALTKAGVGVKFVNPFGFMMRKVPARNHKKILIIDDRISYIGGINFSEHNFGWHDMMVRFEDEEATTFLKDDFLLTWDDHNYGGSIQLDGVELISCDGKDNHQRFQSIIDLIRTAKDSIYVQSPYLSPPFTDHLGTAASHGVKVTVVTPDNNNKIYMKHLIQSESRRFGFDLYYYPDRMTHLKVMLIDGKYLIVGSSNFDCFSYNYEQESFAIITDASVIEQFNKNILEPDAAICIKADVASKEFNHRWSRFKVVMGDKIASIFNFH